MNNILLSRNKYTLVSFGTTDKHAEQQYRLLLNKVKVKQNRYIGALLIFINTYNTFISEKFPDDKNDFLMYVNENIQTNSELADSKDGIYNAIDKLVELENRLLALEEQYGIKAYQPQRMTFTSYPWVGHFGTFFGSISGQLGNCYLPTQYIVDTSKYIFLKLAKKSHIGFEIPHSWNTGNLHFFGWSKYLQN